MQSFPNPLSAKEEGEMLKRKEDGDEAARQILIEHNLRLVAHIVKKYHATVNESEDLLSIGTIGLIKAIDTFRIDRGIRLATYASRCIENEILMMLRVEKKRSREVSLYDPIGSDKEGNEISLLDVLENETAQACDELIEQIEHEEELEMVLRFYKQYLSEREKKIICMRYGIDGKKPQTQKEVGKALGISRSYVSRIEKKALEKLKKKFEEKQSAFD